MAITVQQVLDALKYVDDPDLKKDLVTLNMIKDVQVEGKKISFTVMLTTPACPMKDMIQKACINAIKHFVDKEAEVEVKMGAQVTTKRTKDETTLRDVKNIIAVASGKGGVGKSTLSANLALGLAKMGAKVGLVDADIYGPSQHIMFGLGQESPGPAEFNGQRKMAPVESYGVKINSIGLLAGPGQVIALRGPMATKALTQLFFDTVWGELDYLIVDLPLLTSAANGSGHGLYTPGCRDRRRTQRYCPISNTADQSPNTWSGGEHGLVHAGRIARK